MNPDDPLLNDSNLPKEPTPDKLSLQGDDPTNPYSIPEEFLTLDKPNANSKLFGSTNESKKKKSTLYLIIIAVIIVGCLAYLLFPDSAKKTDPEELQEVITQPDPEPSDEENFFEDDPFVAEDDEPEPEPAYKGPAISSGFFDTSLITNTSPDPEPVLPPQNDLESPPELDILGVEYSEPEPEVTPELKTFAPLPLSDNPNEAEIEFAEEASPPLEVETTETVSEPTQAIDLRTTIRTLRISTVMANGANSKIIIDNRIYAIGDTIDNNETFAWVHIDTEKKILIFADRQGNQYSKKY